MCNFKPGDEVVCVRAYDRSGYLVTGAIYTVSGYGPPDMWGERGVALADIATHDSWPWFQPSRFRKVQRRDLKAWLSAKNTIEGPVRLPERVQ